MTTEPIRWVNDLCLIDGSAWGLDDDLETVWMGNAEECLHILRGESPLPLELNPRQKRIFRNMMEVQESGQTNNPSRRAGFRRERAMRVTPRE